jgi:rhodanese-related sulfurtransferase
MVFGAHFALAAESIAPKLAFEKVKSGKALLFDVREKEEVDLGMAEPAQWMALSQIQNNEKNLDDQFKKINKDKEIILYCRSGRRSSTAAVLIEKKGYKVFNMGGFTDWESANLPTKKGP